MLTVDVMCVVKVCTGMPVFGGEGVYVCCDFSVVSLYRPTVLFIALRIFLFYAAFINYQLVVMALNVVLYCVITMPLQRLLFVMNGSCVVMCGIHLISARREMR